MKNNIHYLFSKQYGDRNKKRDIFETFDAFQVECHEIESNEYYIKNIFEVISGQEK